MAEDLDKFLNSIGPSTKAPESVTSYPGMTAASEKALLYRLARNYFRGIGVIIDAGLFLGASTNAFACGIKDNRQTYFRLTQRGAKPIVAYEIAIWLSEGFDKYIDVPAVKKALEGHLYHNGDSYFPSLQRLLAPHLDLIDFRIGDIEKLADTDQPVEIAFYDCLKTYERDLVAFNKFAPHYIPKHTIVVHQDYFFDDALDLKIRQEFLSPYFSYLGDAATSAVFRLEKSIPSEFFEHDPVTGLSVAERTCLLEAAAARVSAPAFRIYTELAVVRFLIDNNCLDEAMERLVKIENTIGRISLPPRPAEVARSLRVWLEGRLGEA
jgi:hypothetical protein